MGVCWVDNLWTISNKIEQTLKYHKGANYIGVDSWGLGTRILHKGRQGLCIWPLSRTLFDPMREARILDCRKIWIRILGRVCESHHPQPVLRQTHILWEELSPTHRNGGHKPSRNWVRRWTIHRTSSRGYWCSPWEVRLVREPNLGTLVKRRWEHQTKISKSDCTSHRHKPSRNPPSGEWTKNKNQRWIPC